MTAGSYSTNKNISKIIEEKSSSQADAFSIYDNDCIDLSICGVPLPYMPSTEIQTKYSYYTSGSIKR